MEVGTRVETEKNGKGRIAFKGTTQFSEGEWIGVVLDEPKGKNNGTVQGVEYFSCEPNHGLFIRPSQLKKEGSKIGARTASGLIAPASQLRKASSGSGSHSKLSPGSSPGMSPAASVEKLTRSAKKTSPRDAEKKSASSSRLSERQTTTPKSSLVTPKTSVPKPVQPPSALPKQEVPKKLPAQPAPAQKEEEPDEGPLQSPSVLNRVKKMEETTLAAPPPIPSGMNSGTELEYLRVEVKDLSEKLETLRMKRKEDQAKLLEFERCKIQLQALTEHKQKMADTLADTQRQLAESKREATELRDWREANQEDMSSAQEMIEMATIDKEMAEEKAEILQQECDALKDKAEELEAELEILKEEMAAGVGDGGLIAGNSVQVKQLEQQNERLKEALIKLRDANGVAVVEKQQACKQAEQLAVENSELMRAAELQKKQADEAASALHELQEQVDAIMEAEQMVTALTSKNMDLEDKLTKLEQDVEDLEAIHDMDEQLQEAQKQVEKDLLKELSERDVQIQELNTKLRQEEKHAEDLSQTIIMFRKKAAELGEEIQDLKDQCLRYEEQLCVQRGDDKEMAGIVTQMQLNQSKTFAEMVEAAVKGVELEYADRMVKLLVTFLPDNFKKPGGDNDSVILSVLFPRLTAKAKLLARFAAERYPGVPGGMRREHVTKSHKAEQWSHCARVSHLAHGLIAVCGQFETALQSCSLETLGKLAEKQPEMTAQERSIDNYLELVKTGRFDENTSLDPLSKALFYFQNVFTIHVDGDAFDVCSWLDATLQQALKTVAWCKVNSQRLGYFMNLGSEESDVNGFLTSLNDELVLCEQTIIRASKRIPHERALKQTPQFTDDLASALVNLDRVVSIVHEACCLATTQIGLADNEGLASSRVKEMIHSAVEKSHGSISLERTYEPISKYLMNIRESFNAILSCLEAGTMEVDPSEKRAFMPLLERAMERKQAAADAEGLKWQIQKKEQEILDLKRTIKARQDDASNYKLRLEMAEKRMESSGKAEGERVIHLEARVDQLVSDLKRKQIEFDEALDSIQKELLASERENSELRERAKTISKKALMSGLQSQVLGDVASRMSPSSPSSGVSAHVPHVELNLLEQQLADMQQQLRIAHAQISRLRTENVCALSGGGALSVGTAVCGPETLAAQTEKRAKEVHVLEEILEEGYRLKRDEPKFWMFRPDRNLPEKTFPEQKQQWEKERNVYVHRINALRARAHRFWNETEPGKPIPSILTKPNVSAPLVKPDYKLYEQTLKKWGIAAC